MLDIKDQLVSFRHTFHFEAEGLILTSESTHWFRTEEEMRVSLQGAGMSPDDVRGAPDRLGRELVFIAQRAYEATPRRDAPLSFAAPTSAMETALGSCMRVKLRCGIREGRDRPRVGILTSLLAVGRSTDVEPELPPIELEVDLDVAEGDRVVVVFIDGTPASVGVKVYTHRASSARRH